MRKSNLPLHIVFWLLMSILVMIGLDHLTEFAKPTCLETSSVAMIKELKYRDAVIVLEDGSEMIVNQATLKVGSEICKSWSR